MDTDLERYLDAKFDPIYDDLGELKEQARTTNGRIGSLERWRSWIAGGLAMATLFAGGGVTAWLAVLR